MLLIAARMLFGDRAKYLTLVSALAFAALLMNQQGAIFLGLLFQATGPLQNVHQGDLWVMDKNVEWVIDYRPLSDQKLGRVRSVPGVEWAEPFFNGWATIEMGDTFRRVQMIGVSRTTLVGRPARITEGRIEDLWLPDAILVEEGSRTKLGNPSIGSVLRVNDRRAVVVGFCRAKRGFESNAIVYTTFENVQRFTPLGRERISYILVKVRPDAALEDVQADIRALGEIDAFTAAQFRARTIRFIVGATGIGINFSITIALGFLVGLFLSAAVFYQFTLENLRTFAVLKALGARSPTLLRMVLLQAIIVGVVGFGIGVGAAGVFTIASNKAQSDLSSYFPWQLMAGSFVLTLVTIMLGSVLSIRRVVRVSPATVFAT